MGYLDDLSFVTRYLLEERFGTEEASRMFSEAAGDENTLFALYRNLVNVREPVSASEEFFAAQDAMLVEAARRKGIVDASELATVPGNSHICIWRGDITALRVDAIVNAANSQMLGCWVPGHFCIDNAIHTFAGIQLRLECARLMESQGYPEPTGMAKVTSAYNLPSKYVIHTVGPIANGAPSETDARLLANCYTSCLDAAVELGCNSIAFCCISTGVFGFPQREAAEIAVATVEGWLAARPDLDMRVVFDVFGEEDEVIYRELLER